ncbi:MAG TPA: C10 family peptidase [Ignavibacteria bacterium]
MFTRKLMLFILIVFLNLNLYSEKVSKDIIKKIAINWMNEKTNKKFSYNNINSISSITNNTDTLFYIVEFSPEGFIIISADDIALPVLMYTDEGRYTNNLPQGFSEMLFHRKNEIEEARKTVTITNENIKRIWQKYSVDEKLFIQKGCSESISPLLTTKWGQHYPYNKFCPPTDTSGSGGRTWAGCVAVAMAQILKYYNWPVNGKGKYEYNHRDYGKISANFGTTYYDWDNMTNSIDDKSSITNIDAIAKLIYHCGVSVQMGYGPNGSGAETSAIKYSLRGFFRYTEDASIFWKVYNNKVVYSDSGWIEIIKKELINKKPVIYRGNNSKGYQGHAFVVDGFTDNYFHINWGWGGSLNGYFLLTALTPTTTYDFSYDNMAIININPEKMITNVYPEKNMKDVNKNVTLNWDCRNYSYIDTFKIIISTDKKFNQIFKEIITRNLKTNIALCAGNTYYWKILSFTKNGDLESSDIFSFSTKLPDNFYLYQNFPNPFNSQTTISFEIKEPTNVKLKIYSLLGEEVMTLINSYLQPKEYRISFDAKNLPSGVYFYSLETDNFFDIKRFLLLK